MQKQNANFMRDLNVVVNEENNQENVGNNNQEQQYELTQEENKAATNLPAFLDTDKNKM